jgi:hypothetical protein
MLRRSYQNFAIASVLTGFALRALAPVGYMPSAAGDGLLFELCPEQLPPGFVLSSSSSHHDHHNKAASDTSQPADGADQCHNDIISRNSSGLPITCPSRLNNRIAQY